MRFLVVERVKSGIQMNREEFANLAGEDLKYKLRLEKEGKIIGGPFLDILADGYLLETKTLEEMGEIFFHSPINFFTDREVHPLGTFKDSLEGMNDLKNK